mmetsp:Transcript_11662/g.24041  ORF Transcript_11662/g.24041 Transcript_11662/m.24041 type:complete len:232 (-) Transcript_11662:632-1327(-)
MKDELRSIAMFRISYFYKTRLFDALMIFERTNENNNTASPNGRRCSCRLSYFRIQLSFYTRGIKRSKSFRAFWIFQSVAAVCTLGLLTITIMYVLTVNWSMYAVNREFWTCIPWNCDWALPQLNLNCLIMLEIFSNRWASKWCVRERCLYLGISDDANADESKSPGISLGGSILLPPGLCPSWSGKLDGGVAVNPSSSVSFPDWAWEITKKVALSNKTTSSASQMLQNLFK